MSKVNKTIEQVKKTVSESVSSVFTKEDVLKLLKRIDEAEGDEVPDKVEVSREWLIDLLQDAKADIVSDIDNLSIEDVCDLDDIEITLDGRELSINAGNVYFNGSEATDAVSSGIDSIIDEIEKL